MLSRLATKAVRDFSFGRSLLHTTSAVNTKPAGKPDDYFDPWENPERDYVNFPTRRQLQTNLPVRHVIIPESFFKAFHAKTGVTGPYAFLTGLTTFLVSKEIWVLEHEFLAGIEFYIVIASFVNHGCNNGFSNIFDNHGNDNVKFNTSQEFVFKHPNFFGYKKCCQTSEESIRP